MTMTCVGDWMKLNCGDRVVERDLHDEHCRGKTQTYTDRNGHFSGSAIDNRNGTTSFFNRNGSFSGSAGSSIDRAFNFNKR